MEKENWFEKKAIEHGEEQAKNRLYILVKQKTTKPEAPKWYQPWWNQQLRAVRSLKEESRSLDRFGDLRESANLPKEEKAQNGESVCTRMNGKLDVPSGADEEYPPSKYYPLSPEWQDRVSKTLWNLAHRGFRQNEEGDNGLSGRLRWVRDAIACLFELVAAPSRMHSSLGRSLAAQEREGVLRAQRQIGKRVRNTRYMARERLQGRSKAMDKRHCYPVGRGRADKLDREGKPVYHSRVAAAQQDDVQCMLAG